MKYLSNFTLILIGLILFISYVLTKNQFFSSFMKDNANTVGLAALFGAILISIGLLNIFITFYITDKSEK